MQQSCSTYVFRLGEGGASGLFERTELVGKGLDVFGLWVGFGRLLVGLLLGSNDDSRQVAHSLGFVPLPLRHGRRVEKLEGWDAEDHKDSGTQGIDSRTSTSTR